MQLLQDHHDAVQKKGCGINHFTVAAVSDAFA
jgi:hypothetical protein